METLLNNMNIEDLEPVEVPKNLNRYLNLSMTSGLMSEYVIFYPHFSRYTDKNDFETNLLISKIWFYGGKIRNEYNVNCTHFLITSKTS